MPLEVDDVAAVMADLVKAETALLRSELTALRELVRSQSTPQHGRDGLPGVPGPPGRDGEKGALGLAGERGGDGPTGPAGVPGPQGEPGVKGEKGDPGERGADGSTGPQGLSGERGERGEAGPQGPVGPQGEKGLTGEIGPRGEAGECGKDAPPPTREQVIEAIKAMPDVLEQIVATHLKAHPPKDGKDGRDGIGLTGLLIDKGGQLVATLSDGAMHTLGVVVGKDGSDGAPGRDGLGFDDFDLQFEGDRKLVAIFRRGSEEKRFEFLVPALMHQGVFVDGKQYEPGDVVTWGGAMWLAKKSTNAKPDTFAGKSDAPWQLCVMRGREGKQGPQGLAGKDGKDLRK